MSQCAIVLTHNGVIRLTRYDFDPRIQGSRAIEHRAESKGILHHRAVHSDSTLRMAIWTRVFNARRTFTQCSSSFFPQAPHSYFRLRLKNSAVALYALTQLRHSSIS